MGILQLKTMCCIGLLFFIYSSGHVCQICDKKFDAAQNLDKHLQWHYNMEDDKTENLGTTMQSPTKSDA
jgi:hypothetical protein